MCSILSSIEYYTSFIPSVIKHQKLMITPLKSREIRYSLCLKIQFSNIIQKVYSKARLLSSSKTR